MNTAQFIFVASIYSTNVAVLMYFKVKRLPDIDSSESAKHFFCMSLLLFLASTVLTVLYGLVSFYKYLGATV